MLKVLGFTQHWHFAQNEDSFKDKEELIHFPVRDPLDTLISWLMYEGHDNNNEACRRYELAIDFLKDWEHGVKYYIIENIQPCEGRGPLRDHEIRAWRDARDLEKLKTIDAVVYLLEWLKKPNIKEFFDQHYPQGFWYVRSENETIGEAA